MPSERTPGSPAAAAAVGLVLLGLAAFYWNGPPGVVALLIGGAHAAALLRPSWVPAVLAMDAALVGWNTAVRAPAGFQPAFDTTMHLALVRRVAENGLFPPDAYFYGHPASPVLALIHQVLGSIVWATGASIETLWLKATLIASMATFAALAFAYLALFGDRRAALLATVFHMSWRYHTWGFAAYPRNLSHGLTFLSLGLLWRATRSGKPATGWAAGGVLGLAVAGHAIGGAMGSLVVAAILAVEIAWRRDAVARREAIRLAGRVVVGAMLVASPWLVSDLIATLGRGETPPALLSAPSLWSQLVFEWNRWISPPGAGRADGLLVWGAPLLLGALAIARDENRATRVYVCAAAGCILLTLVPPLRDLLLSAVTSYYVSRFAKLLPLAAIAGAGLASLVPRNESASRPFSLAGAATSGLAVTALLAGVTPWREPLSFDPPPSLDQPELRALEPDLRGRVVLTHKSTAYLLPYLTGAYVTWNTQFHSNPVAYVAERNNGARVILSGRAQPGQVRAYVNRYEVDFALIPAHAERLRTLLLRSGVFRERSAGERYALFERVR